ncbi:sulfotransferase [uncultured Litoreibacter sp.]|uniref:sulfotransferase family protein n=1 Tax=uncultured Litoreibacter sp. TaxID=1392394 RepID=UPI00261FC5A1|nr:sulfotransferase [uncultured Litoreibacter sp.]
MKFCIVGTGRCGTTLLWRMMNSHPDLFVFRETHWIPTLFERFGIQTVPSEALMDIVQRTNHVTGDPVVPFSAAEFAASPFWAEKMSVPEFCEALARFLGQPKKFTYWADKTPDYFYFVSTLQTYWPECEIIHLIRDGADVSASMSGHPGYQALAELDILHWPSMALDYAPPAGGFSAQPMRRFARLWHDRLQRVRDEAPSLKPGSYHEVRYEDILADPKAELRLLTDFVGISANEDWLEYAASLVQPNAGRRHKNRTEILESFDEPELQLMKALGYE